MRSRASSKWSLVVLLALSTALSVTAVVPTAQAEDDAAPAADAAASVDAVVAGLKSKDDDERRAAVAQAAGVQDDKVLTGLLKLLDDDNLSIRSEAAVALAGRSDPKAQRKAADGIAKRLRTIQKLDGEAGAVERLHLIQQLHDLAQPSTIDDLVDPVGVKMDEDEIDARLHAVANVPDDKAIDALIQQFAAGHRRSNGGGAARRALQYATGQDVRGQADEWRAWWKEVQPGYDHEIGAQRRKADADRRADREAKRDEKRRRGPKDGEKGNKGGKADKGGDGEGGGGNAGGGKGKGKGSDGDDDEGGDDSE